MASLVTVHTPAQTLDASDRPWTIIRQSTYPNGSRSVVILNCWFASEEDAIDYIAREIAE